MANCDATSSEVLDLSTLTESVAGDDATERSEALGSRQVRSIYLITYSRANEEIVPNRESFVQLVLDSFDNADPLTRCEILQWVCSQERHRDGAIHYHMAVKLNARRRWLKIRNYLDERHRVKVNFSARHSNYYSACQYTTKEDESYLQSDNHPDLTNTPAPNTSRATEMHTRLANGRRKRKKSSQSLSVYDVSQIAVKNGIKTRLELLVLAQKQKSEGKLDLAQFIANRGSRVVDEAIFVGWELENAESTLQRSKMTRIEILYSKLEGECEPGCDGQWLQMAKEVLERNSIVRDDFAEAVRILLDKGRGKYRNLYLKGPCNCAKTFLLNPLNTIYKTFSNPASTTFAWVGAEQSEVVFLNDFRWSAQIIPWHDFLMLLEGQSVHLPAPKTHYRQDILFQGDTPIFCTSKDELSYVRGGVVDDRETQMMKVRWRVFNLFHQIPEEQQKSVPPCGKCFSRLIFPQDD